MQPYCGKRAVKSREKETLVLKSHMVLNRLATCTCNAGASNPLVGGGVSNRPADHN
jgi:hypothetical protein